MMRSRPVAPRASRTALIAASVPLEVKRRRSIEGIAARTSSPSSTSRGDVAPSANPSSAAARTASTTSGRAWPRSAGPHEPIQSTYQRPSASRTRAPAPESRTIGAGADDGDEALQHDPALVDPAALGSRLDQRVLAAHLVGADFVITYAAAD